MEPAPSGDRLVVRPSLGRALVLSVVLAGGAGVLAAAWPAHMGVVLSTAERVAAGAMVGGLALLLLVSVTFAGHMVRRPHLALGTGGVGVALALGLHVDMTPTPTPASPADGPDVWVISLDTVRADHLVFTGLSGPHADTPALAALAQESWVFRQAYAPAALTGPSHVSAFTGQHPWEHGVHVNGQHVPDNMPWLPELLLEAGWRTHGLVSAAVLDEALGYARGFSSFDCAFEDRLARGHALFGFLDYRAAVGSEHHRGGAQTVALLEALDRDDGPTFTWIHLYDAHWPYTPSDAAAAAVGLAGAVPLVDDEKIGIKRLPDPRQRDLDPERVARGKGLYRAELADLDDRVAEIMARVPDDAVVVVFGDHGESLDEHDYHFSHGRLAHSPDTHVPLLVRLPSSQPRVVDTPVTLADVAPTILRALGLPVPPSMSGDALHEVDPGRVVATSTPRALLGLVRSRPHALGDRGSVAVRDGQHSLVWTRWSGPDLYDRRADPLEASPLEEPVPAALAEALSALTEVAPAGVEVDPATLGALEALGYIEALPPEP